MDRHAVAIIPARGASKRIPRKNVKPFCGRPILCYSIDAALSAGIFEEVMVSTDDPEIAGIARKTGASVPFFRSAKNAGDHASTDDVIMEVLNAYATMGKRFDAFCCLYPTAPFVTAKRLREAMELLKDADSVMPVVPFSYPPLRGLILRDGRLTRKWPEYSQARSQDLEIIYHDCGQFYACKTAPFLAAGTTDLENLAPMILSELETQDIDTEEDWMIAELKYRELLRIRKEGEKG